VTTIALVDDHLVVAQGVAHVLATAPGMQVLHTVRSVAELLAASDDAVDVTVLDARLGDGTRLESNVDRLHEWGTAVVVLTANTDATALRVIAFEKGVLGFQEKSVDGPALVATIAEAATGAVAMTPDWARALRRSYVQLPPQLATALRLYAGNMETAEVAQRMNVKPDTVKKYIQTIRERYEASGRPANGRDGLIRRATEDGYLRDW
jgi:DNA-binding NarL/FixJ family response regulator